MKAALAVPMIGREVDANLALMERMVGEAGAARADLVLFGEAAPTGLINNDDPTHDLPLGDPIPGPVTKRLARCARRCGLYLATGLLERKGRSLYDSAVLLDPDGTLLLKYRRIQPQWHGRTATAAVYRQGVEVASARIAFGAVSVLLCGDLFDDEIVSRVRQTEPDYLLFPFARNFSDGSFDQERWDREEEAGYVERAAAVGCTTLMVNMLYDPEQLEYPSFGGALAVSAAGDVLARWPLGKQGILYAQV
jgi:N-carbamoylputrescine amidase